MMNAAEKNFAIKNALFLLPLCVLVVLLIPVLGFENEQDPSFKYSKEANKILDTRKLDKDQHNQFHHNGQQEHVPGENIAAKQLDIAKVWLHAIGSTLLISAAPFVVLFIIPLDNSDAMKPRLKVILAFAAGGLLGDAFLHLIPHSTHLHYHEGHSYDHQSLHKHSEDMLVGLWVLGGIIVFLVVEKLVRLLKLGHAHSHLTNTLKSSSTVNKKHNQLSKKSDIQKDIEISGYLNIAADFAHNFTDGLAIGASYMTGNSIGLITTLTILLHEVPHEIGDFAILIKSGCSRRKAMMLQLFTAVGAIAGTMLALLSSSDEKFSASWVLPFTAGGFIYIATVNVLPELLQESTKFIQSIKEILALLSGVCLMVCIASIE